tara:strand:+ start:1480 stop:1632 length:153 start_codon:yes stop_codon:yes gene_type:complete
MTQELIKHLEEIGVLSKALDDLERVPDTRHVYLEKGYFNDPRNLHGEVSF